MRAETWAVLSIYPAATGAERQRPSVSCMMSERPMPAWSEAEVVGAVVDHKRGASLSKARHIQPRSWLLAWAAYFTEQQAIGQPQKS